MIEVNVTKIVKYVCITGIVVISVIFGEKAYEKYLINTKKENS